MIKDGHECRTEAVKEALREAIVLQASCEGAATEAGAVAVSLKRHGTVP